MWSEEMLPLWLLLLCVPATCLSTGSVVRPQLLARTARSINCAAASLVFGSPMTGSNDGRQRLKYSVSWQAPDATQCPSVSHYVTNYPTLRSPPVIVYTTQRDVYADGKQAVSFYVTAVYADGKESIHTSATITTGLLRPQISPKSFVLTAVSQRCVRLSWRPPQYPNGEIIRYKYSCGDDGEWKSVDKEIRDERVCSFTAYQQVKCNVKTVNGEGESNSATAYTMTECAAPIVPTDITSYVHEEAYLPADSSLHRRKVTINVPTEVIEVNCEQIVSAQAWFQGTDVTAAASESLLDLDALTTYNILYQVTNNRNLASDPELVTVTTGELEPLSPQFSMVPLNLSCVMVNWKEPSTVTGEITNFQCRCAVKGYANQASYVTYSPDDSPTVCGFQRADVVSCEVRANSSVGYGPSMSKYTTTHCQEPSKISVIIEDAVYNASDESERATIYVHSQDIQPNCDSISSYSVDIKAHDGTIIANGTAQNTSFIDLELYTMYNISVEVVNNENLSESLHTVWRTPTAKPGSPPSLHITLNSTCAALHITDPQQSNGVISHYKYYCQYATIKNGHMFWNEVEAEELQLGRPHVCGFKPASSILCSAIAINSAGESPPAYEIGQTTLQLAQHITTADLVNVQDDSDGIRTVKITIQYMDFENVTVVKSSYRVLVGKEDSENSTAYSSVFFDPERCDLDNVQEYSIAKNYKAKCYTAAEVDGSLILRRSLPLTIGDGNDIGGYYNAPLQLDTNYSLTIAIDLQLDDNQELTFYLAAFFIRSSPPPDVADEVLLKHPPVCSGACVGRIVGGVIAAVIVICLIAAFLKFRRRVWEYYKDWRDNVETDSEVHFPVPVASAATGDGYEHPEDEGDYHPSANVSKTQEIRPPLHEQMIIELSTVEYENKSKRKSQSMLAPNIINKSDSASEPLIQKTGEKAAADFLRLEMELDETEPVYERGANEQNLTKTRSAFVLPDDEFAVSVPYGGYINAVYVNSYDKDDHIIATHLPLKETMPDFWQMIEKCKVRVVVQLDRDEAIEELMYGDIEGIEYGRVEQFPNMTRMSLRLKGNPVTVFLVRTWSSDEERDDDLPDLETLLSHTYTLNKHQDHSGDGIICVMDIDGKSRCGLFIAAYNLLLRFKDPKEYDVTPYDVVLGARQRRRQFLSTPKEHEFIYQLEEHFNTEYSDYKSFTKAMIMGNNAF